MKPSCHFWKIGWLLHPEYSNSSFTIITPPCTTTSLLHTTHTHAPSSSYYINQEMARLGSLLGKPTNSMFENKIKSKE